MNRIDYWGGCLLGTMLLFVSCDKDIDSFEEQNHFVYFDMPYMLDEYGRKTTQRADSISYSFELDDISVTSYTFKIPVNAISLAADKDRKYKVEVVADETTATDSDWDKTSIANTVLKAGEVFDTLNVKVFRTESLRTEWKHITFRIVENEEFGVGYNNLLKAKISFSDQLEVPEWWPNWQRYFGDFCREKYLKWREIYYLGADPNKEQWGPNTGKPLYWGNMPYYYSYPSWYPTTFMFVKVLKQYFIDNEVYPDGDTSKPRVTIPY